MRRVSNGMPQFIPAQWLGMIVLPQTNTTGYLRRPCVGLVLWGCGPISSSMFTVSVS
jgi:hypothetical protein